MYLAARDRYRSLAKSASIAAFVICLLLMGWFTWVGAQLGAYHAAQHEIWNNVPVKVLHQSGNLNASDGTGFYNSQVSFTDPSGTPHTVWTTLPRDNASNAGYQDNQSFYYDNQTFYPPVQSCYDTQSGDQVCASGPGSGQSNAGSAVTVCAGSNGNWFNASDIGHYEASKAPQDSFDNSQPSCPPPLPSKLSTPSFASLYQSFGLSGIVAILVYWLLPFVAAFKYRHRKGVSAETRLYEQALDELTYVIPDTPTARNAKAIMQQCVAESSDQDNVRAQELLGVAVQGKQALTARKKEYRKRGVAR